MKLFKREDSDKMIEVISRMDGHRAWSAYTSNWTLLEVTRALRKDGKPKELIDLNLKELRSHNIKFQALGREIMAEAESNIAGHNVYASDSVHVATFRNLKRRYRLDAFLTDDKHFLRLKDLVTPLMIRDIVL